MMIAYNSAEKHKDDIFFFTEFKFYWPSNQYNLYGGGWSNPTSIPKTLVAIGPKILTEWRDEV
jgi:hypothetical protein